MKKIIREFSEFYPLYLAAHSNRTNKILHFAGTSLLYLFIIASVITTFWWLLIPAVLCGYFFAGIGHHHFEQNKSFRSSRPIFCVAGSFLLYFRIWRKGFSENADAQSER